MGGAGPLASDYMTTLGFGGNRAGRAETLARSIGTNPGIFVKYPALTGALAAAAGGASGYGLAMGTMPEGLSPTQEKFYRSGLTFVGASLAGLLSGALRRHKMQAIGRKFDEANEMNPTFRGSPGVQHFMGGSHAAGRLAAVRQLLGEPAPELTSTQKLMYAAYNVPYVDMATMPVMNAVEHMRSHTEAQELKDKVDLDHAPANDVFVEDRESTEPGESDKRDRAAPVGENLKRAYAEGFAAALEKRAVTLEQLRAGNKALVASGKLLRNVPTNVVLSIAALPRKSFLRAQKIHASEITAPGEVGDKIRMQLQGIKPMIGHITTPRGSYGDLQKSVVGGGRPFLPEEKEILNRMVLKHEGDELRYANGAPSFVDSHSSPGVILQEHNVLTTLKNNPEVVVRLREVYERMRGGKESTTLAEILAEMRKSTTDASSDYSGAILSRHIPGFVFGQSPRVSRHFIKNIDRAYVNGR